MDGCILILAIRDDRKTMARKRPQPADRSAWNPIE